MAPSTGEIGNTLRKRQSLPSKSDVMSQPDIPSIPTTSAGQVDNSLESSPCVSDTDHQRPQRDRRSPAYLKDYVCS